MTNEIITEIFEICILPLLGILTTYLVFLIKSKMNDLAAKTDNQILAKHIELLSDIVCKCVLTTKQTYVESLKKEEKFDKAAQEEAFKRTKDAVMNLLTDETKKYLTTAIGDLDTYVNNLIESTVNENK